MKKNESIQILRAVAALLVVHLHSIAAVSSYGRSREAQFFNLTSFGACGVGIFFTISGFILSTVAMNIPAARSNSAHGAVDFLIRRLIRIFPIYWVLSCFFVVEQARLHHLTLARVVDSFLLLPSLSFPMHLPLMFVGWTLIFEMFFYYIITINLFFGSRRVVERTILTILAILALGALVGFRRPVLILLANPINLEFLFGCLTGLAFARFGKRHALGTALLLVGAVLLVSTLFLVRFNLGEANYVLNGSTSWRRVWIWGIPAAMVTAGLVFRSTPIRSSFGRFGVLLGDASYSIYLISLIVFVFYEHFYPSVASLGPDVNVVLSFFIVVASGLLCYRFLERPMTRFLTAKYHGAIRQAAPAPTPA